MNDDAKSVTQCELRELPAQLTRGEVAQYLRKHPRTIDRMIEKRELQATKIGNRVLISRSELARLLAGANHD